MKTTAQMIETSNGSANDVIEAMRAYKREYAASAPPAWIGTWFPLAWQWLRDRGWSRQKISAALA
jgi:hypothetical protein